MVIKLINKNFWSVKKLFFRNFCTAMSPAESNTDKVKKFIPKLTAELQKGDCGRIGVIGGSAEYTGAPYFTAISALRTGADLVFVFCCKEAAPVIKSYSPELIVLPFLDNENFLDLIGKRLNTLHALVIGPGLGRDPDTLKNVEQLINYCREEIQPPPPLIIDADGLYMLTQDVNIIKSYNGPVFLTPNSTEYSRLKEKLSKETPLQVAATLNAILVQKGTLDVITNGILNCELNLNAESVTIQCSEKPSFRRCGGQGDILAGCLATFVAWLKLNGPYKVDQYCELNGCKPEDSETLEKWYKINYMGFSLAAYGACLITKTCSNLAFKIHGRSMTASDMIGHINEAFVRHFSN